MRRAAKFVLAALALLMAGSVAFVLVWRDRPLRPNEIALATKLKQAAGTTVALAEVHVDPEWDHACYVWPYAETST